MQEPLDTWKYQGGAVVNWEVFLGLQSFQSFAVGCLAALQIVGVFLESGSPEEQEAAKKLAREQPTAPPLPELEQKGMSFAMARM